MINSYKFLIFLSFFFISCNKDIKNEMPNIILIMNDDQGWGHENDQYIIASQIKLASINQ